MKELQSKYIEEHKKTIKTIEKWMEETGANAVIVTELAKELKIDTRTLNKHLEVLELSKYGHFNKNRHLFLKEAD
uniref:Uncharacterized protein n=1 Tax=viral metagenome TaxID=1070528 RepID=A0A6M3X6G2_9ZZZZ